MGKTNISNLKEDKILVEEVRKYPCLYDKADKGYKERDRTANAWRAVDLALEGTSIKRFDALRKRFNKRRKQLAEASRSGSGTVDVAESSQKLKEYSFLSWLRPYIQQRRTKTNLIDGRDSERDAVGCDEWEIESNLLENEEGRNDNEYMPDYDDEDNDDDGDHESCPGSPSIVTKNNKRSTGNSVEIKPRAKKVKQSELVESELEMMKTMAKVMQKKLEKSSLTDKETLSTDDLFGKLIASEIKQLPTNLKMMAKHEIHNVLHRFQMQSCNAFFQQGISNTNTPPTPVSPTVPTWKLYASFK